jgi:hypothetical protein
MKSEEAIEHIEFIKELTAKTRLRAANSYPFFILWGIICILGYLGIYILPLYLYFYNWWIMWFIGMIISVIIFKKRKNVNKTPLSKRINLQGLTLFISDMFLFWLFIHYNHYELLNAFWPFQFGIIYIITGIHIGRELIYIGLCMLVTAILSFFIPETFQHAWLAITYGGGVLSTGIIFRNQIKIAEDKITN